MDTQRAGSSPLYSFFHFFPIALWVEICVETNRYRHQTLEMLAKQVKKKQKKRREVDRAVVVERLRESRSRLRREPTFLPHEICVVLASRLRTCYALKCEGCISTGH